MSIQTKISFLFKSTPVKRSLSQSPQKSPKSRKIENSPVASSPSSDQLAQAEENCIKEQNSPVASSPCSNQLARAEDNRIKALAKLHQTRTQGLFVNVGPSWMKVLEPEIKKEYFQSLCKFVAAERNKYTIYPPTNEVFSWTRMCAVKDVKVVIIGQDPYHGPNQAHGLCFSVKSGVSIPPSLVNMYQELSKDIPEFEAPKHGTLIGWAKQGVLLLNACLTVRASQANSHKDKGWEKLTDAVIKWLNDNCSALVFILWGSYAQKKGSFINQKKHCVLKGVHPSPLSAHRGFFGCHHFSKCNEYLQKHNKKAIDWNRLPLETEKERINSL